jgi:RND family efflux transporter MFP subunit
MNGFRAVLLIIAITVAILFLLVATRPDKGAGQRGQELARVQVIRVSLSDLSPGEELAGRLQPKRMATLRAEVKGTIRQRPLEPGVSVKQGEILLQLDDGDYRDALLEATSLMQQEQAGIARDRELLKLARRNARLQKKEVERLKKLRRGTLVARSNVDAARQKLIQLQSERARLQYSVVTAEARLSLRKAALERARRNLERCRLRAPFDGVVNKIQVQVGDYVNTGQTVAELIDNSALEMYVEVRREVASALKLGQPVEVIVGERRVQGRLVSLQRDPDSDTFTHAVRVRLPAGVGQPGDVARARFPLQPLKSVLSVPASALVVEGGNAYVMLVKGDVLHRRPVKTGPRIANRVVVSRGLQSGDIIVSRDVASLADGQKVIIGGRKAATR